MRKRLLSIILALAMIVSLGVQSFADEGDNNLEPLEDELIVTETTSTFEDVPAIAAAVEAAPVVVEAAAAPVVVETAPVVAEARP